MNRSYLTLCLLLFSLLFTQTDAARYLHEVIDHPSISATAQPAEHTITLPDAPSHQRASHQNCALCILITSMMATSLDFCRFSPVPANEVSASVSQDFEASHLSLTPPRGRAPPFSA